MSEQPNWILNEESKSIREWTDYLNNKAKKLFIQDGTHASILFSFKKNEGLVSINVLPPKEDSDQVNEAIVNAINNHNLYGVIYVGEAWTYSIKENDHTAFQILDGEMKVADLKAEDKGESLMIKMENRDGECVIYLHEIIRDDDGYGLKESTLKETKQKKWFT